MQPDHRTHGTAAPEPRTGSRLARLGLTCLLAAAGGLWPSGGPATRAASPPAELISTTNGTAPMLTDDDDASMSGDGQVIVFTAATPVPTPGFSATPIGVSAVPSRRPGAFFNGYRYEVWVRDRANGTTTRAPIPVNGDMTAAGVVSRDGCHVAYWADVEPVEGLFWGVYTWNRCQPGSTPALASPGATGLNLFTADLGEIAISADGRFIAYSAAVDGPSTVRVAVSDTVNGTETTIPGAYLAPTGGVQGLNIDISDDGSFVTLDGREGQTNVVVGWEPGTGARSRITVRTDGVLPPAGTSSFDPSVSADGRFVAFASTEANVRSQVYVYDRATNTTRQVTGIAGAPPDAGQADAPEISADGTQVVHTERTFDQDGFWIEVVRSTSGFYDTVAFELVSYGTDDQPAQSLRPTMSATGRFVAFTSFDGIAFSGNPAFGDRQDVWLRERPPALSITTPLDFGSVTVGSPAAPLNAVVTNTSNVAVPISGVTPPGAPFTITADGCTGAVLQPGATCTVGIGFTPAISGPATSTVAVSGEGVTATADLRGVGATPGALTLTPASNNFGAGAIGTSFPAVAFTVTNTGGTAVGVTAVGLSGAGADQFAVDSNGCAGASLAPAASCQISVSSKVTKQGQQNASLDVNGSNGQTLGAALQVTGNTTTQPTSGVLTLTPATADFGTADVGTALPAKAFTAKNTGGQTLTVTSVAISGPGTSQFAVSSNGCLNKVLAVNATCQIQVTATPTQAAAATATLTVTGNGGQSDSSTLQVTGTQPPQQLFTPTLVMNPGVARPGQVTTAVGAGFPPGAVVQLAFDGEAPFATVTADASGAFRYGLLLLPNGKRIGGYDIVALDQPQFTGVRGPLLVDQASFEPSGTNEAGFTNGLRALYGRGG
jgi:hypothetical protein